MGHRSESASVEGTPGGTAVMAGTVAVATDMGRVRTNNEDNFLLYDLRERKALGTGKDLPVSFDGQGILVAVADGMGGHNSGQVASQLATERLPQELTKLLGEKSDPPADFSDPLIQAIQSTNASIYQTAKTDQQYEGMGTTLTAMLFSGSKAWIAQVGDSRCYLFRDGKVQQLTHDQTLFNSLREEERAALKETPFENMLLQALGAMTKLDVAITPVELQPDALFLLCSDGLYKVVKDEKMAELLDQKGSLQDKANKLVEVTNAGGGPDNVTVVLCRVAKAGGD